MQNFSKEELVSIFKRLLEQNEAANLIESKIVNMIKSGWKRDEMLELLELTRPNDDSDKDDLILGFMDRVSGWTTPNRDFFKN